MSLENKIKDINELKRYTLAWEWMEEYQSGEYVKYDDVVSLLNKETKKIKEFEGYIEGIGKKIEILDNYLKTEKYHKYPPITVDKIETKLDAFISELSQEILELKRNKYNFKD